MNDYYTDEPIDWQLPDEADSQHDWDYVEPEADREISWADNGRRRDADDAPEPIHRLCEMIRKQPWQITASRSFYEQAVAMADFEDDAPIVDYMNYFPTYRDMTVAQMRSYFTIRKMFRQGKFPEVSLSYIFVYVYETLMQIGINTAEEGYEILQEMLRAYSSSIPKLKRYLNPWLRDYVVYHNLEAHFSEMFAEEQAEDRMSEKLADYKTLDDDTLFTMVCSLSKYNILNAALYKKEPEKTRDCTVAVLRAIIPNIEAQEHHHIETIYLGKKVKRQVAMFSNAVFYDPKPVKSAEIQVASKHKYICRGGLWTRDEYTGNSLHLKSVFGGVLHEVDRQLRQLLHVSPAISMRSDGAAYASAVHEAIVAWYKALKEKEAAEEAERRRVRIDFSKLGKIRSDADVVKEKLLVEEDSDSMIATIAPIASIAEKPTDMEPAGARPEAEPASAEPAEPTEKPVELAGPAEKPTSEESSEPRDIHFLRLFLSGGDWKGYLREIHVPEGVMVENINNKMLDEIGDIVLEDNGDGLQLIEDYREEIENLVRVIQ